MAEHGKKARFHSLASMYGIGDLAAAYAVQREYVRLQQENRKVGAIGYKVGLTSPRMQAMCGIDNPIAGVVLADRVHISGSRLKAADYGRLGLEFEIAVRMGRDFRPNGHPVALSQVAEAIDAVCAAIEIVDDRDCDYKTLDVLSLVADNSWNAGIVLGEFRQAWPDLASVEGVARIAGDALDRGIGRDVLGHPFQSVAWLAGHLAAAGDELHAGDIVMTGNLVTTKFPAPPADCHFEVTGLGSVTLSIEG